MVGGFLEGRKCCRWRAMEVASFVPGHVQNMGATPRSWTALCSKRNKVAKPCYSNRMERRGHDAPCAGARTFFSSRRVHGQRGAPGRPCAPSVPRCFYFGRKTDFACQDVSAAAEKRARWNCRWHPTTAGPMDDCCSLLLAALARAGRAGAHSSVSVSAHAS